jgi:flagellin-specific chaperone FliS
MNPYRAYQGRAYSNWLRIDLLLALYDGAIERLEAAVAALRKQDRASAAPLLARARLIVAGLISGVDPSQGELAVQFLRLYEFVNRGLEAGSVKGLEGALRVLRTLREGLRAIRPEAVELERQGHIPPADALPRIEMTV